MNNFDLKIKVQVSNLIDCLEQNLAKHLSHYAEAKVGYFKTLREEFSKRHKALKVEDIDFEYNLHQQKPVNNEAEYAKYIRMFKLHTEPTIEIDVQTYNSIVEDSWTWAMSAFNINTFYSGNVK